MQTPPHFTIASADPDGCRPEASVRGFARAAQVIDCWHAARGARQVPLRNQIAPAPLGSALGHCFIAALVNPRVARLRIAGSALCELMGMDVRGMPLTAFFVPATRPLVIQATEHLARGVRAILPMAAEHGLRRPPMDGLLVLLPLSSDGSRIDMALGVLDTVGVTGTPPRRFASASPAAAMTLADAPLTRILRNRAPGPARQISAARRALRVIDGGRV